MKAGPQSFLVTLPALSHLILEKLWLRISMPDSASLLFGYDPKDFASLDNSRKQHLGRVRWLLWGKLLATKPET